MTFLFYILSFTLMIMSAHADTIYLYRSAANTENLDLETSRRIFDGSKLSWANGKNIVLLVKTIDEIDESSFFSFSHLSKTQFIARWRTKFYSGRALMPIPVKNPASELEILKTNPSSIYFSFQELPSEIFVDGKENYKIDSFSF